MRLNTVQLSRMDITDPFWKQYTDLVEDVIIPYQWDIMNDNVPGVESSHCLENFKIAAGLKKGTVLWCSISGYRCSQVAGGSRVFTGGKEE